MFVGLAILCKRFVLTAAELNEGDHVYRSAKTPGCVSERQYLYKLIDLAKTGTILPGRKFTSTFVLSHISNLKTKLTVHALESRIKRLYEMENGDSFQLFSMVSQVVDEILLPVQDNDSLAGENGNGTISACVDIDVGTEVVVSANDNMSWVERVMNGDAQRMTPADLEECEVDESMAEITKILGYNRFMIKDVLIVGCKQLKDDNVLKQQVGAFDR